LSDFNVEPLRQKHYNATVIARHDVTTELFRIRVRPDRVLPKFQPGQYVAIGLGYWEPRVEPSQHEEVPENKRSKMVLRAYSISCPLVDDSQQLVTCDQLDYLEFYIALVRGSEDPESPPPALTPRLFGLSVDDRLFVASKITGKYNLEGVEPSDTVLMISTGTGEAPHNAMAAELLHRGHRGKVINLTTARHRRDFGYAREQDSLMKQFPQYRYLALTTREPENLDPKNPAYVGKVYVQDLIAQGKLAQLVDDPLTPDRTHVYLCGNPAMIGFVPPGGKPLSQPGVLPLLQQAGFTREEPGCGHVRFEKYW